MPVSNILAKRIGRELREWIFLGIRTGMRRGVADYRSSGDIASLKRAVDLPHKARTRINHAITTYGQQALVDALASNNSGDVTLSELNAELTSLEAYAQGLVDTNPTTQAHWDALASDIETNIEFESERWVFKIPDGYVDIWGE